jgi:hypothetical protein
MGVENPFPPVKLFCGLIYSEAVSLDRVQKRLAERCGAIQSCSDPMPFIQTDYYRQEMGDPLWRRFVVFSGSVKSTELPDIKRYCNQAEIEMAVGGKRTVNIDPGYLSLANVVIATTKNHFHRIPLRDGIYAHLEYIVKHQKLLPLEWTYPDFLQDDYLDFFDRLRRSFKEQLRSAVGKTGI